MAKKKKRKSFSVDEAVSEYLSSSRPSKDDEDEELEEEDYDEEEEDEEGEEEEWEVVEPKKKDYKPRYRDEGLEGLPKFSGSGRSKAAKTGASVFGVVLILLSYLLRGFAISLMCAVAYFVAAHNFLGVHTGNSFVRFALSGDVLVYWVGVFLLVTGFEFIYYLYYMFSRKKLKEYEPKEMLVSYGMTVLGIFFALLTVWYLGFL